MLFIAIVILQISDSHSVPSVDSNSLASNNEGQHYKLQVPPLMSHLYYDKITRRFYFAGDSGALSPDDFARSMRKKKPTGVWQGVWNFFHSTFVNPFYMPEDRKPPKGEKLDKKKPTTTTTTVRPGGGDFFSNFLDDLDDMLRRPFRDDESAEKDEVSSSGESGWFNWLDDDDSGEASKTSDEDDTLSDDEKDDIYEDLAEVNTSEKNPTQTTQATVAKVTTPLTPIKKKNRTNVLTSTTSRRPVKSTTSKPPKRKTATTRAPRTPKPRRPSVLSKKVKDCAEKAPPHWISQVHENSNAAAPTAATSGGWFGFFDDDDDDDDDNTNSVTEASNWFSGLFNDDDDESLTSVSVGIPMMSTSASFTPEPTWFNTLMNLENDDEAYSTNTTKKTKKAQKRSYKGFQLLRINPNTVGKLNNLKDLKDDTQGSGLMWWSSPALNKSADLLVPPDLLSDTKDHLSAEGFDFNIVIWDLQNAIAFENQKLSKMQRLELEARRGHPLTWRRYHRYADILRYMEYLSLKYPDLVELIPLGRSYEGLPIMAAKVSIVETEAEETPKKKWKLKSRMKPAIWIDGGSHAREWISPAVATWILHALVEGERGKGAEMDVLKMADWYILPVVNPDGYEYTHTKDRLWRKTRSVYSNNIFFNSWFPWTWGKVECYGVDLNRNWDFHWGEKGSSNDPCSDYYAGPKPFSEPESRAISNFIMGNKDQLKLYLTLHAYSQMWVIPSSHSKIPLTDKNELMEMGKLALNALKDISGTKYDIGSLSDMLSPITGTSYDWAKGRAGIKYTYAVKLRDASGPYGYLLPGAQIIPTAKETWEAIKIVVDNL